MWKSKPIKNNNNNDKRKTKNIYVGEIFLFVFYFPEG